MSVDPLLPGEGHAVRFDPAPLITEAGLAAGMRPAPDTMSEDRRLEIVRRVAESYKAAKHDQSSLASPWLPDGEWADHPVHYRRFYAALLEGSVETASEFLGNFWRNELGLIVKEYASFGMLADPDNPARKRFVHNSVRNWLITRELTGDPASALATPPVGNPWGYEIDGTVLAPKACRYHLFARELSGMIGGLDAPTVAEIGGGYGGLTFATLSKVPQASWINYDLPETAAVYAYFVACALGPDRVRMYGECAAPRRRADMEPGCVYVMPNYAIRDLGSRTIDAFVNMFSLSEVGAEPLAAYIERIHLVTDGWFMHHNMDRAGVVTRGHERIPASTFPVDPEILPMIATGFDPFHGIHGDYRWFIHKRPGR